jgi:hypothetical protein
MKKLFGQFPAVIAETMKKTGLSFDEVVDVDAECVYYGGYGIHSRMYQLYGEPRNVRIMRELTQKIIDGTFAN